MTTAGQPQQAVPVQNRGSGVVYLPRVFMFAACVLFVIAAIVAGGTTIVTSAAWAWGFGGFASVTLSWALSYYAL